MRYRVVVVDDHRLVIEGVRRALVEASDFEVVGEARDGAEALPLIGRLLPDVVLLDIRMPRMDGFACLALIRKRFPAVKVAMLSVDTDPDHMQRAFDRGASAYIVKSIAPSDLPGALRQAMEGTVFSPVTAQTEEEASAAQGGLSERETTILRLAAAGRSNRQIARELWVTEQTVKFHLTKTYRKLGVVNRTQAARAAFRTGIAQSPALDLD